MVVFFLQEWDKSCPSDRRLEPMTEELIDLILSYHNDNRNTIALGKIQRYQPATRMCTMVLSNIHNTSFHYTFLFVLIYIYRNGVMN